MNEDVGMRKYGLMGVFDEIIKSLKVLAKFEREDLCFDYTEWIDSELAPNASDRMISFQDAFGKKLENKLSKFDKDTLLSALSLLYYGFESGLVPYYDIYTDVFVEFMRDESKDGIIGSILDMMPTFHKSIKVALERLLEEGFYVKNILH